MQKAPRPGSMLMIRPPTPLLQDKARAPAARSEISPVSSYSPKEFMALMVRTTWFCLIKCFPFFSPPFASTRQAWVASSAVIPIEQALV